MKINIQSLERDLIEVDGEIESPFEDQEMHSAYPEKMNVHVILDKFGKDYRVDVHLETKGHYSCDRCLVRFTKDVIVDQRQIYHVGESKIQDDQEITNLPSNTTEIDLSPVISEMIWLNHPLKMLCKEDCKGLCPDCGADLNKEICSCTDKPGDPRWASLRKLIK